MNAAAEFLELSKNAEYYFQAEDDPDPLSAKISFIDFFTYRKHAFKRGESLWVKIRLENNSSAVMERYLSWTYTRTQIHLWKWNGGEYEKISERTYPWLNDYPSAPFRSDYFPVQVLPGENIFLFQILNMDPGQLFLYLWSPQEYTVSQSLDNLIMAFFIGINFIIIFYNLALYFSFRDRQYLYFLFFIFFGTIAFPFRDHYYHSWGNLNLASAHVEFFLFRIFVTSALFSTLLFAFSFMRSDRKSFMDRSFFFILFGFLLVSFILPFMGLVRISAYFILAFSFLLLVFLGIKIHNSDARRQAVWLLGTFGLFVVGSFIENLRAMGIIGYGFRNIMFATVELQNILLSFYMTYRINMLRGENEKNQKILLDQAERYASDLEKRVDDRTKELKKQAEELESANLTKDKLFSILAHDLKGPIGSISLIFDDLKNKKNILEGPFADTLRLSAKNTYNLLDDILTWARSQKDQIDFRPEQIKLSRKVDQIISLLNVQGEIKNIKIVSEIPEHIFVLADNFMLSTILRNLISNAIKFTEEGGRITIRAALTDNGVEVSVVDSGLGMTEEKISKLFKLSRKSSSGISNAGEGTGIGLLLCRDFVERHGGVISVESFLNKGSIFRFTLPDRGIILSQSHAQFPGKKYSELKVLLVEDDFLHREVSLGVLRSLGCRTNCVSDGNSAVQEAADGKYDLIMMDINIPGKSGIESAKQILSSISDPPILIALSSYSRKEIEDASDQRYFDVYLQKPLQKEELRSVLGCLDG